MALMSGNCRSLSCLDLRSSKTSGLSIDEVKSRITAGHLRPSRPADSPLQAFCKP